MQVELSSSRTGLGRGGGGEIIIGVGPTAAAAAAAASAAAAIEGTSSLINQTFVENGARAPGNATALDAEATALLPGYPFLLRLLGREMLHWVGTTNSDAIFRGTPSPV